MNLVAPSLSLQLEPVQPVDSEDGVRVRASVIGWVFTGTFEAYLQLGDLRRFHEGLEMMYALVGSAHEAVLSCHEPGICVRLASNSMGQVAGTYEFENEDGSLAKLAGSFQIDQSYLPALAVSTHALIASLSENAA
jgi:hypothetical protein